MNAGRDGAGSRGQSGRASGQGRGSQNGGSQKGSGQGRGSQNGGSQKGSGQNRGSQKGSGQSRGGQNRGSQNRSGQGGSDERRNAQGRERNRSGQRRYSAGAPAQRTRTANPPRLVAFEVLRAVEQEDAYANLILPSRIRAHRLDKRDAGFATELAYGALRGRGTYDAILARCVDRDLARLDPAVLDALRLGCHQLLAMRVPVHAALDETVGLARAVIGAGPSGLINAVLRRVSERTTEEWVTELTEKLADATAVHALAHSHPEWIVRALRQALVAHGRAAEEITDLLEADNAAPRVNLVGLDGLGNLQEAFDAGAEPSPLLESAATYAGGDVGRLAGVRAGTTRIQDAGSQLVARALVGVDADGGPGTDPEAAASEQWLDLCAGPGGKAALMAALAAKAGASVLANEPAEHRANLVRQALAAVPQESWSVRVGDGRDIGTERPASFDKVLVDAPCSGLGALRRRPEARWRRTPSDVAELGSLQRELLDSALRAVKPGGVVAYVTCSPHPAETIAVVSDALRGRDDLELLDAGGALDAVAAVPLNSGHQGTAQLWPHIHQTDAMFLALIRRRG